MRGKKGSKEWFLSCPYGVYTFFSHIYYLFLVSCLV